MTIDEIKNIDLISYLAKSGLHPKRSSGKNAMYLSPFVEESVPSFAVNRAKNTFKCYSSGVSGSVIDFVMHKEGLSFTDACNFLSHDGISDIKPYEPLKVAEGVKVHTVEELTNTELIDYIVGQRKISEEVVFAYCKQVSFSFPNSKKDSNRIYTAIGFQTGKNSWELRNNTWIKIAAGAKMVRTIKGTSGDKSKCIIFEGWLNAMTYLTMNNLIKPLLDIHILNGVGQIRVFKPFLEGKTIYAYVDSDRAGDDCLLELDGMNVIDMRHSFPFANDLNDYWVNIC